MAGLFCVVRGRNLTKESNHKPNGPILRYSMSVADREHGLGTSIEAASRIPL